MSGRAVLVGSSTIGSERDELVHLLNEADVYKVAVDGGINVFLEYGIKPDYWLGDMDSSKELGVDELSVDNRWQDIPRTKVPSIKNDTDMGLAIEHVVMKGSDDIIIYGGLGGRRMSHSLANIQLIHRFAKRGIKVKMVSESDVVQVLVDGELIIPKRDKGYVSIFSLADVSSGVNIKNLFYEYEGELTSDYALGVSNEFIGKEAVISVENGALLIVYKK